MPISHSKGGRRNVRSRNPEPKLIVLDRWLTTPLLLLLPLAGLVAVVGLGHSIRRQRDSMPFLSAVLGVICAFLTLVASFWPYMIPYEVTVQDSAAPPRSLAFLFWGGGLVIFPVVLIYTGAVFWIFRGKVRKNVSGYGAQASLLSPQEPGHVAPGGQE